MEGAIPSRSNRKRPYLEDLEDIDNKPSKQLKKVRFPKGKKIKSSEEEKVDILKIIEEEEDAINKEEGMVGDAKATKIAAKERAKRRNSITAELFSDQLNDDVSTAEVAYEDNENFVDNGIQIEPFNLDKEREEGYFDEAGNFVEYVSEKEVKDAWLDSVAIDPRYAGKDSKEMTNEANDENDVNELSSEDIGMMKKRIAGVLEPGETVLQALRRLKGGSGNRKVKMSPATQALFDQLTEDANKLLDQGEYNVYHDKQEVFKREAEGYEKLAIARGKVTSLSTSAEVDPSSDMTDLGATSSKLSNSDVGTSNTNVSTADASSNGADDYDMFADDNDDDKAITKPSSNSSNLASGPDGVGVSQLSSDGSTSQSESGFLQDDFVYDETSGYYYSSSSGYYYDPATGLYCHAASGQWYSYNEETGTYNEINQVATGAN